MALVAGLIAGNLRRGFDSRAQVENELRARERYLTLINITTQDFLTPVSLEDKYYSVISHLANLLTADYGHLILWDKAQEKATLVASTRQTDVPIMLDLRETNIISQVLQNGDALAIDNAANSDQVVHPARSEKNYPIPQSLIYIPLITKEDKLGVVILAFLTPHHFSQNEVYFAELACRQVVLALQNALQDIEIKERLRESHKLYEISQALSKTEAISLDHVLQLIANSARELIPGTEDFYYYTCLNHQHAGQHAEHQDRIERGAQRGVERASQAGERQR
jgi:GAF domain-containing protein